MSVKWYLIDEELADHAFTVWQRFAAGAITCAAPYFARHEVASGLVGGCVTGKLAWDRAAADFENYLATGISVESDDWLFRAAFDLARSHPVSAYDAIYLALAEALGGRCVTADHRLWRGLASRVPYLVWLGDIPL